MITNVKRTMFILPYAFHTDISNCERSHLIIVRDNQLRKKLINRFWYFESVFVLLRCRYGVCCGISYWDVKLSDSYWYCRLCKSNNYLIIILNSLSNHLLVVNKITSLKHTRSTPPKKRIELIKAISKQPRIHLKSSNSFGIQNISDM